MDSWERADLPQAPKSAYSAKRVKNEKLAYQGHPHQPPISCPECGSKRVWRDGLRYPRAEGAEPIQRWLCRSCGYRFTQPNVKVHVFSKPDKLLKPSSDLAEEMVRPGKLSSEESVNGLSLFRGEDVGSHGPKPHFTALGKRLNKPFHYNSDCRVCVSEAEAKNLAQVSREEQRAAGATEQTANIKGKIVEFGWWLKKQGRSEHTIANYMEFLKMMVENGADILNPESVKEVLARLNKSSGWKHHAICAANAFLKMHGLKWDKPKCVRQRKLPFIPLESELDNLVAGSGKKVAAYLQLLKETGMRAGEALRLKWTDVDFERQIIILNQPEKGSNPRVFKVSSKLIGMLNALPRKSERLFPVTYHALKRSFTLARKKTAVKLANPRLLQISFHTFRHWKATMEYHRTKDPLYVKELLGHKKLDTTLLYIQIERTIFQDSNDEFTVKTASTPEEIKGLLEVGFEYVCEKDGLMFFRKRK